MEPGDAEKRSRFESKTDGRTVEVVRGGRIVTIVDCSEAENDGRLVNGTRTCVDF